jgi:hypothetical protein
MRMRVRRRLPRKTLMPIQTVEHWEEKARLAEETAEAMAHAPARFAMLEIAQLYRKLAENTRKLTVAGDGKK